MFKRIKKTLTSNKIVQPVGEALVQVGKILVVPQKMSRFAYKTVLGIASYTIVGCVIALAIAYIIGDIWFYFKPYDKSNISIVIFAEKEKLVMDFLENFDNKVIKPKFIISKTSQEFLENIKSGHIAIIQGKEQINILETSNIFFPLNGKYDNLIDFSLDAINRKNLTYLELCNVTDDKITIFDKNATINLDFKTEHSIVIGRLSQGVNDLQFMSFVSFITKMCYNNSLK